ncbi:MAG: DUF547 domain-containing protein [Candidatus Eisenbacteria bacterium]|nr:DUF547 domain-containing protein [Candidatus Eisenbacteria bacterium]
MDSKARRPAGAAFAIALVIAFELPGASAARAAAPSGATPVSAPPGATLAPAPAAATRPAPAPAKTVSASGAPAARFDHSAFDRILSINVRHGLVDYRHIRAASLGDLDRYLDRLAAADPGRYPREERLAFEINLYNATMIRAVVARLDHAWSPADSNFAVFHAPLVRTKDGTISLDDLENRVIRAAFHEPRVHVALVCAARSCPPILPRAYRGDDLDRTLENNLRAFLADSSRNRVDEAARRLRLSSLFRWYAKDFASLGGAQAIASRALTRDSTGWKIEYLDYDWTLNITPH